ncbi:MAG: ATPase [Alphaproteobacteria bacterium]|nr:ATPase [Alphaproteobacteria bacterium]
MKRVYERVGVAPDAEGWHVLLDDRPLRTPGRELLAMPTAGLAQAVAAEWAEQGEVVRPHAMPLMQLAATAIDRVRPARHAMVDAVARYAQTDLVCYRADAPPALVARQHAAWQPLVDWAALVHDAALRVVYGVMPEEQPAAALAALRTAVAAHDEWRLAALSVATSGAGSLVIGLALLAGRIDAGQAWEASQLDELFQVEQWGEDAEAAERRAALRAELAATERFARLADR